MTDGSNAPHGTQTAQAADSAADAAAESEQPSQEATQASHTAHSQSREAHDGKHVHHGSPPAAWVGVSLGMLGFFLGGIAVVGQHWTLFIIAVVICLLGLVAAKVLQSLGFGAS